MKGAAFSPAARPPLGHARRCDARCPPSQTLGSFPDTCSANALLATRGANTGSGTRCVKMRTSLFSPRDAGGAPPGGAGTGPALSAPATPTCRRCHGHAISMQPPVLQTRARTSLHACKDELRAATAALTQHDGAGVERCALKGHRPACGGARQRRTSPPWLRRPLTLWPPALAVKQVNIIRKRCQQNLAWHARQSEVAAFCTASNGQRTHTCFSPVASTGYTIGVA